MHIIKTENKKSWLAKIDFSKGWKKLSAPFKKNVTGTVIVLSSMVLIVGAVYINWVLFAKTDGTEHYNPTLYVTTAAPGVNEPIIEENGDSYFAMAQIERTRARDEALEVLYSITQNENATEEVINDAYESISALAKQIETEANIETLVKGKGFSECVAVIEGESIKVIVSSDGLSESEVAQIQEIVYNSSGIMPANTIIIEK